MRAGRGACDARRGRGLWGDAGLGGESRGGGNRPPPSQPSQRPRNAAEQQEGGSQPAEPHANNAKKGGKHGAPDSISTTRRGQVAEGERERVPHAALGHLLGGNLLHREELLAHLLWWVVRFGTGGVVSLWKTAGREERSESCPGVRRCLRLSWAPQFQTTPNASRGRHSCRHTHKAETGSKRTQAALTRIPRPPTSRSRLLQRLAPPEQPRREVVRQRLERAPEQLQHDAPEARADAAEVLAAEVLRQDELRGGERVRESGGDYRVSC